jgi:peptidoglycan/LPS O-acetylase OafA/YrhL
VVLKPFELFLVITPISIGIAAVSFRYFEAPIMNWRHRRAARLAGVGAAPRHAA